MIYGKVVCTRVAKASLCKGYCTRVLHGVRFEGLGFWDRAILFHCLQINEGFGGYMTPKAEGLRIPR